MICDPQSESSSVSLGDHFRNRRLDIKVDSSPLWLLSSSGFCHWIVMVMLGISKSRLWDRRDLQILSAESDAYNQMVNKMNIFSLKFVSLLFSFLVDFKIRYYFMLLPSFVLNICSLGCYIICMILFVIY